MKKMTYAELKKLFREHEKSYPAEHLTGYIVFAECSFDQQYSLESRTYVVSSDNKAFRPNMGGYSIYAYALDGNDPCVRLEQYMKEEKSNNSWIVDYCYVLTDEDSK